MFYTNLFGVTYIFDMGNEVIYSLNLVILNFLSREFCPTKLQKVQEKRVFYTHLQSIQTRACACTDIKKFIQIPTLYKMISLPYFI